MSFGEMQIEPGKPRKPLNDGTRALRADELLGGPVELLGVTPGADLRRDQYRDAAWTSPEAAICVELGRGLRDDHGVRVHARASRRVFEAQRRDLRADVVVDLGRRPRAVEAAQQPALARRSRRAARSARGRPSRRFAIVSGLSSSRWISSRAVDVADALVLRRVELDVVDAAGLRRDAAAGEAADDLFVGDVDQRARR